MAYVHAEVQITVNGQIVAEDISVMQHVDWAGNVENAIYVFVGKFADFNVITDANWPELTADHPIYKLAVEALSDAIASEVEAA